MKSRSTTPGELGLFLCSVPDQATGAALGRALVEARLAACVNVVAGLRSIYRWQGEIHDDAEALLLIKARTDRFDALERALTARHPYQVPELIGLPLTHCHRPYLDWALEMTGGGDDAGGEEAP